MRGRAAPPHPGIYPPPLPWVKTIASTVCYFLLWISHLFLSEAARLVHNFEIAACLSSGTILCFNASILKNVLSLEFDVLVTSILAPCDLNVAVYMDVC